MARKIAVALIDLYKKWVSPLLPPSCRFHPSCSAYAREAYLVHGALKGTVLTLFRLLKCHPLHPGGFDPVPARFPAWKPRRGKEE
ncbi:MAG TPA: membrane protein insertion efficiency factor YidD [Geobacteraceae bacterium]